MDSTSRVNIYINNEEGRKALHEMEDAIRKNDEALAKLTATGKKNSEQAKALRAENERLTKTLQEQKREVGLTALSYSELKKQYQSVYREWAKAIPGSEHRAALEKQLGDIKEQIDATSLSSKKSAQVFEQSAEQINSANLTATLSAKGLIGTLKALWTTIKANPIGAVLGAAGTLWMLMSRLESRMKTYNAEAEVTARINEKIGESVVAETTKINLLHQALTDSNLSLEKRRDALKQLQAIVPEYHASLTESGRLVGDNTEALNKYIQKVKEKALAEAYAAEYARLVVEKERKGMEAAQTVLQNTLNLSGLNANMVTKIKALWANINGDIDETLQNVANMGLQIDFVGKKMKEYALKMLGGDEKQTRETIDKAYQARRDANKRNLEKDLQIQKDYEAQVIVYKKDELENHRITQEQYDKDIAATKERVRKATQASQEKYDAEELAAKQAHQAALKALNTEDAEKSKAENKKKYDAERTILDGHLAASILAVKQAQAEGKKNEQTAADEIKSLKARHLNSLLELQEKYGQDTVATQTEMADIAIANAKTEAERAMAITRRFLKDRKAALDAAFKKNSQAQADALKDSVKEIEAQMKALVAAKNAVQDHLSGLVSGSAAQWMADVDNMALAMEQSFYRIDNLVENSVISASEGMKKKIEVGVASVAQIAMAIVQNVGNIMQTFLDAQMNAEEERYNKALGKLQDYYSAQIDAAAGNEDEIQRIREEYAEKKAELDYQSEVRKLDIEKKAADAQFAINVATATAQAALAIVQCFAMLGPIAGPIAAAVVAASTAVQIYAMKKQRDAIKSKTIEAPNLSSSSSGGSLSPTGTAREITPPKRTDYVRGYEDGGYTDVIRAQDGRRFRAKVNPRGRGYIDGPELLVGEKGREFVANADAVNNPHIRPVFDIIDQAQRLGTVGRLNMRTIARSLGGIRARGYAAGGYTGADGGGVVYGDNGPVLALLGQIHDDILQLKEAIRTDHRAYVVLSDLNAMQQKLDAAKKLAKI